jgi:mono/diheme cytochrome c family protein
VTFRDTVTASLFAAAVATAVLGSTFGFAAFMQRRTATLISVSDPGNSRDQPLDRQVVAAGHSLFLMNCAHCHGDDARGDEGPDLHGLVKSDARLRALIKNGIKGEMPRFSEKLADADIAALVAFLRSLR